MREGQEFATGNKRALMHERWDGYEQRWAIETFQSGLKRTVGSTLSVRTDTTMRHGAALMVLTYALRV